MKGHSEVVRVALQLSRSRGANRRGALRQYEPHWSPSDPNAEDKLTALAEEIRNLLMRLGPTVGGGSLGRRRDAPALHLAPPIQSVDRKTPDP